MLTSQSHNTVYNSSAQNFNILMALEGFLQSDTESKVLNLIRENSKIGNSELRLLFQFVINPKRTVKLGSDSREVSFVEIAFKHCNVEALKMLLWEFGANPNICRGHINLTTNGDTSSR